MKHTPLVFLHGAGLTGDLWEPQRAAFPGALFPSLPGRPGAAPGDGPPPETVDAFGAAVIALLDAGGYERAHLIGASLGGAIALHCALAHAPRVASITAIGSGARMRVSPQILEGVRSAFDTTVETVAHACLAEPAAELHAALVAMMHAVGAAQMERDYRACDAFDVMARLGAIGVPALVVCGTADVMTPLKYSQFLAAQIPGAQFHPVDGAGHLAAAERAPDVNARIAQFVALA